MKVDEPFTGLAICLFAFASYADDSIWASGCCAGVGAMMVVNWACSYTSTNREAGK